LFTDKDVTVYRRSDVSFAFKGVLRGKLYLIDFIPEEVEEPEKATRGGGGVNGSQSKFPAGT
jgi:hypothetical protein